MDLRSTADTKAAEVNTIEALQQRLDFQALEQLRAEVANLSARLEFADERIARLEADLSRAVEDAYQWQEQALAMLQEDADSRVGLSQDGRVVSLAG